ncbi:hypothetical protein ATPR_1118 [Acetobacter tropicalis NBRC 101654]|uniref:Uncharacterized protein n=1 Tax=Acetobacter tropicalis NBRC 101654 TaxID=749388 RepID=F7VCL9_9PROT|nr:hypothetical protein ATPR_1118 [Acetobacter tropicalis NBRC 101654]
MVISLAFWRGGSVLSDVLPRSGLSCKLRRCRAAVRTA